MDFFIYFRHSFPIVILSMLALLHDLKTENIISELNYQFAKMIDRQQQAYDYTLLQQNLAILFVRFVEK